MRWVPPGRVCVCVCVGGGGGGVRARAVSDLNVKLLKEEVGPEKENGLVDYVLLICKRRDDRSQGNGFHLRDYAVF